MSEFISVLFMLCQHNYSVIPKCTDKWAANEKYVRKSEIKEFQYREYILCSGGDSVEALNRCKKQHYQGCEITFYDGAVKLSQFSCDELK